jgi:arginine/lysine/ornithine decarboxylase
MPGHKYGGNGLKANFNSFWDIDITEIPGADNLHDPEDILLRAKERAAVAYGARESFFLVNGSSCGIMAMIMGTVKRGEKVIVSRDAHRSVHQAVMLGGLHPIYLMPKIEEQTGIAIGLDEVALEKVLKTNQDIKAVVCTYPSYSGFCTNMPRIRELTTQYGVQLLVDEAHGAHLWLSDKLPPSALTMGADVVVQSLHKTMPALTQTAILHIGTEAASRNDIAHFLTVFQSSSPSYVLLSSIDEAIGIGSAVGGEAMAILLGQVENLKQRARVMGFEFWDETSANSGLSWHFDMTKLCLSGHLLGLDGYALDEKLKNMGIQSEYAMYSHVLLMTTIGNTVADFQRLEQVLAVISQEMKESNQMPLQWSGVKDEWMTLVSELVVLPAEASDYDSQSCELVASEGQIAADWIIPYPPGVPILCPGERMTRRHLAVLETYLNQGHKVLGIKDQLIRVMCNKKR